MLTQRKLPDFARESLNSDPSEHRCPHDAWLESLELGQLANGERSQDRISTITLRLLGAYHDAAIVFQYSDVKNFSIASGSSAHGLGDWLDDQFSLTTDNTLRHDINWCFGAVSGTRLVIRRIVQGGHAPA